MRFEDLYFSREERFAVGLDRNTGGYYLSIPVSYQIADAEEYYTIPAEWAKDHAAHMVELLDFAARAKRREVDELLILKPGKIRGVAS